MMYRPDHESPTYTGPANGPFAPRGEGLADLTLSRHVTRQRLDDRLGLLGRLDTMRRDLDHDGAAAGIDAFTARAMEMIVSPKAREAFDLDREPRAARERYGDFCRNFLLARRLVEAGVSVVTLKVGDWDTHEHNFRDMRAQLPLLDQGFHALVTDLEERGLSQDVVVLMWGEFGRAPRISRIAGRDHWPEAGAAVVAGGGFRVGQAIGATDSHAGQSQAVPYTPSNLLANVYRHLGIDPAATIPDRDNRPMYVLDQREPVRELG
jgi:uncharacterized protein (DUF1501 family)